MTCEPCNQNSEEEEEPEVLVCCPNCNKDFSELFGEVDSEEVCESCHDESFCCERCEENSFSSNEVYETGRFGRPSSNTWCDSCEQSDARICTDCDANWNKNEMEEIGGSYVCPSCYDNYFICECCGQTLHNDDYSQDGRCNECDNQNELEGELSDYCKKTKSRTKEKGG